MMQPFNASPSADTTTMMVSFTGSGARSRSTAS